MKKKPYQFRIEEDVLDGLQQLADKKRTTVSQIIREVLFEHVKKPQTKVS